jgi:CBS domain-containing protein
LADIVPSQGPPVVPRRSQVRQAIDVIVHDATGGVVATNDDGTPAGMLTETDVVRRVIAADRHPWVTPVESVMTEPVVTVEDGCTLDVAGRLMADRGIRHLGVTRGGRLAGWVTARSLIAAGAIPSKRVGDAMTKLIATIHLQETVREAADRMLEASIGLLLVGGRRTRHRSGQWSGAGYDDLAGIVTEADLVSRVMAVDRYPYVTSVGDVMTPRPVTVRPDDSLTAAADLIVNRGIRHVLVADGAEVVGVISIRDLLPVIADPGVSAQPPNA